MTAPAKGDSADFHDYPFLSPDEFAEACHHLDRIYRHATLGPLRRRWRLHVRTAFNTTSYAAGSDYTTYLQITRPVEDEVDGDDGLLLGDGDGLAGQLGKFSMAEQPEDQDGLEEDEAMAEAEAADEAALPKTLDVVRGPSDIGFVTYEIHLHPTYRAPCLWFSLHGLPEYEPAFSIDTVFRRLVPDAYKDGLRAAGSIGGISADSQYHPLTGVPSFFVHPCLLGEAMSNFDCSKQTYLMVWLGLVGGCVGLWVPKEMALVQDC